MGTGTLCFPLFIVFCVVEGTTLGHQIGERNRDGKKVLTNRKCATAVYHVQLLLPLSGPTKNTVGDLKITESVGYG